MFTLLPALSHPMVVSRRVLGDSVRDVRNGEPHMTPPDAPDAPTGEQVRAWIAEAEEMPPVPNNTDYNAQVVAILKEKDWSRVQMAWEIFCLRQVRTAVPRLGRALLEARRLIEGTIKVMEQHDAVRDEQGGGPACGMEHPVILHLLRAFLASGPPDRLSGEGQAEGRP